MISQINSLFDPERFPFLDVLGLFWHKILDNPLILIITLLVLIGLPYFLFKSKESNAKENERKDRLMEQMEEFEINTPFDDSPVTDSDQDVLELSLDNEVPDLSIKAEHILQDLESVSSKKQLTLDQEVADDLLATGPRDLAREMDDENPDGSDLIEENFDEVGVGQPEPGIENEKDASPIVDDLQIRMEQAIEKLRQNYPSREVTNKPSNESRQEQDSSNKTNLKTTEIASPAPNKTADDEYQESLEAFLFLKDQNKPE